MTARALCHRFGEILVEKKEKVCNQKGVTSVLLTSMFYLKKLARDISTKFVLERVIGSLESEDKKYRCVHEEEI